jgi:prevent-host-death family protein
MKTASVREIQHHLSRILNWVEDGEEVTVTKNKKIVAKIVPAREKKPKKIERPDFAARRRRLLELGWKGKPVSEIIDEARGERP